MQSIETIWPLMLDSLKNVLNELSFETWVKPSKPISLENNQLLIEVPTPYHIHYWNRNIAGKFVEISFRLFDQEIIPKCIVPEELEEQEVAPKKVAPPTPKQDPNNSVLNPKYTFDTFVIGKGQMAHAAVYSSCGTWPRFTTLCSSTVV